MFLARFSALCFLIIRSASVPPQECFANFRWDDCGKPPEQVIYYWKPGSRCEVGTWRGCLPNPNMFKNEYECVETCVFNVNRYEREENVDNLLKTEDSVETIESDIEKGDVGLNETSAEILNSTSSDASVSNESEPNVTLLSDEVSPSNATSAPDDNRGSNETAMASDKLPSDVDSETIASNDSSVRNESTLALNNTLDPDEPTTLNESIVTNDTTASNNTLLADDTPASDDTLPPAEGVGSNETAINEGGEKQKEVDNKPEEDKPPGRSRLASFLKGK